MRNLTPILFLIAAVEALAQAPVINSISPVKAGPSQKVVITGSGFNTTASQNLVSFDHVKATPTTATAYSLEVLVPPQARYSNIEVLNLGNNLSGKSSQKFMPSYGGVSSPNTPPFTPAYTNASDAFNELYDIASADFDLDGKPDIVTSRGSSTGNATDLYLYKNASTGIGNISYTRYDKATLPALNLGFPTTSVAAGDLNGDGKPDIVATRGGPANNNQLFVLKNSNTVAGTLAFNSAPALFLESFQIAFAIAIRDLNGDGKPEIIVSNSFQVTDPSVGNPIYIFPNISTVSSIAFGPFIKLNVAGAATTYGLDVQDLDGDSRPDIVVTQYQQSDIFIFRNTSTGNISFDPMPKVTAPGKLNLITTADINNDGLLDLIASAALDNNVQIWTNKSVPGNFQFNSPQTIPTSIGPWGVNVSDIDGDGDADLVVANKNGAGPQYNAADTKINIFRQDASMSFIKLDIVTATPSRNLRVGDYDGDGKPDIAYSIYSLGGSLNTLSVLRNTNCWAPVITSSIGSTSPVNICVGQTVILQTPPALGATYTWSPTASATNTLTTTNIGTYTVTVTGTVDTGCINPSAGFTLSTNPNAYPPNPTISNNTPCLNSTLNLSTTSVADNYIWAGPNNFASSSPTPSIPVTSSTGGAYTLQLKMNNGCLSDIVSKTLDVASVPVLPITASPSATGCVGGAITLSVPSNAGYTYQWNKAGTPIGSATSSTLSLPSLTAADQADYTVGVTSTANSCSQSTAATTVNVYTAPGANFTFGGSQCVSSLITFTDTSLKDSRGTLTYNWTFGDASTSQLQNPTHTYQTANTFSVSLQVSYSGSCPSTTPKTIVISAAVKPTIVPSANPICAGDQATLSVSGTYNTFTWTGVTGSTSSVTITQPGAYGVTATDANGCSLTDAITIGLKPALSPFSAMIKRNGSKTASISLGDTTQFIATSGADSYLWSPGATLSDSTIFNPIAKPDKSIVYIVVAKKATYCDAIDTLKLDVNAGGAGIKPPLVFTPNGDLLNDKWKLCQNADGSDRACPEEATYVDWTMTIYDGRGSQVYTQKGFTQWDGNYEGKASPNGTYYYVFTNSKDKPTTGHVLLVR